MQLNPTAKHPPMSDAHILHLDLGPRSYDIHIQPGALTNAGQLIEQTLGKRRLIIISDENVAPLYASALSIDDLIIVPAGEQSKSFDTYQHVLDELFKRGADRKTVLVALGGGVVGDLTGFVAATYMRGLDFVQIPTSLLAQVDSSVGGKTGINVSHGKNLVGAFYQPKLVIIDPETLTTLDPRHIRAGYAEIAKIAMIKDADFFDWLDINVTDILAGNIAKQCTAIAKSCALKADIVAQDEREGGIRALLNFGHTFGHALETATGCSDRLYHGEAVAMGMTLAARLSEDTLKAKDMDRIITHLQAAGLETDWHTLCPAPQIDELMQLMKLDKKTQDSKLNLILLKAIGDGTIFETSDEAKLACLWEHA